MVFIYILELENNKYYIGKTLNPNFRLEQHLTYNGSEWTKKYKPKKVLEIIQNCDDFDEDKYTLKYMKHYGISNVRGGTFCKVNLDKNNLDIINKMITSSTDKCYICGKYGHFAKDCYKKINILKDTIYNKHLYFNSKNKCYRCGREGHYSTNCYALKHINGKYLGNTSF